MEKERRGAKGTMNGEVAPVCVILFIGAKNINVVILHKAGK